MAARRSASAVSSPACGARRRELLDRVAQPFGLAARALDLGAMRRDRGLARAPLVPQPRHLGGVVLDAAIGVEQRAMGRRIDEGALVVLAVNLDQGRAERAQHLHADRLIVDEGAGAAVGELHPPHDQFVLARRDRCRRARGAPDGPWRARRRR